MSVSKLCLIPLDTEVSQFLFMALDICQSSAERDKLTYNYTLLQYVTKPGYVNRSKLVKIGQNWSEYGQNLNKKSEKFK